MGSIIGAITGTAGGAGGTGYAAPSQANIQTPTTSDQATNAYAQNQTALQQQQAFLQAVQAQNGLANQSSVYNQLQGVTNGTGPNPAQAQLAQATGANVANQAALMAGQRGSGANAGLIARQAAQQGAATQQQAAGQAATLQANQSLNALSAQGNLATQQAGQQANATGAVTSANQNEQNTLLGGIAAQNNANVGMQSNINSANAGLANTQLGAQNNLIGNITGGVGSALGLAKGGEVKNYDQGDMVYQTDPNLMIQQPTIPSAIAAPAAAVQTPGPSSNVGKHFANAQNAPTGTGIIGNTIGSAIGKGLKSLFSSSSASPSNSIDTTDQGSTVDDLGANGSNTQALGSQTIAGDDQSAAAMMAAKGGLVKAMLSPGEKYLSPAKVEKVEKGASPLKEGKTVPGKPKVKGAKNSYANDTVSATLESGGIVLPRSVTKAKDPAQAAHKFVSAMMAKNNGRLK